MILIVDSDKSSETKTKQFFSESGFDSVVVANSANSAREIIKSDDIKQEITLIIIDHELEDANGFEFCREISKTTTGKNAYIMMLVSSAENKTAIEKARHSGASGYSVKPVNSAEFLKHFFKFVISKVVLLIEDDPVIRMMVKKIISNSRIEIIEFDDGIKAHNLLNKILPARLVLMDIGLPNKSGIQLVEQIRSKVSWRKTTVVMLTASSDVSDVKKCLSAGANDYLTKPIVPEVFKERLGRYLPDEN
ncbi:MAG: hypothetical protein DIZ80_05385 [endosymbiont of Galathealinum brachiosum]|uniref:Response regulatory domain-containing protein n=1 Tax=endosymbiont of Galathealinum brachiosum TaxID=2200906 RepID=A0A370DIZ4_9GAMM|nr:MAG: hypothetical protein DIZ80_05385 [endosymbiont of Galathealinum brachiosum]